eukprot:GEMP01034098.1.p1 GENE.GEMP01034098.1~~GEMP01034098.1.p1  ORF type:complete len:470 (+),score=114.26 GEMP01034098.1:122-1531(+)
MACVEERVGGTENKFGFATCPITGQTEGNCPVTSLQVYGLAALKKQEGNEFFRKGDYDSAIRRYSDACTMVPTEHVYFLNRSKAHLKVGNRENALADAETALALDPHNVKAVWQQASVLNASDRKGEAIAVIHKAWEENDKADAANQPLVLLEQEIKDGTIKAGRSANANNRKAGDSVAPAKDTKSLAKDTISPVKGKKGKVDFFKAIGGNESRQTAGPEKKAPPQLDDRIRANQEKGREEQIRKDRIVEKECTKQSVAHREKIIVDCIQLMKDGMPRAPSKNRETEQKTGQDKKPQKQSSGYEIYTATQKNQLVMKGGHQFMPHKPQGIALPPDFKQPIGVIDAKMLGIYNCTNLRKMLSVLGRIFDVSDRPDKYGEEGPYWEICGKDITWGLYIGDDNPSTTNQFYDLFKTDDSCVENMMGVCGWILHFENEYGNPVGQLTEYRDCCYHLPEPPKFDKPDIGACSIQ